MNFIFIIIGLLALLSTVISLASRMERRLVPIGVGIWGFGAILYFATTTKIVDGSLSFGSASGSSAAAAFAIVLFVGFVLTMVGLAFPVKGADYGDNK